MVVTPAGIAYVLRTPQEAAFFRGGSSHARGKRPPAVKGGKLVQSVILQMNKNNC
ncbi:hypothetical protein [Paraliobacillus salinarum]|uniref:hypothetical protein n=1 Tax=Paraliobacillus salinarum TaxID=1158996 RepID=UPI0015F6184F|nr:hypothetical protein [Paraliobacillus salinarum]